MKAWFPVSLVLAATILASATVSADAEYEPGGQYDGCVRAFYDPATYGWLTYQNVCPAGIQVRFIPNTTGFGGGIVSLSAGHKDSAGESQTEVDAHGGFTVAVCGAGYLPVDSSGVYLNHAPSSYRCRAH